MKFVPEGRVLLTVAVDQLSKKRRAVGQSYDDAKNAAWAELRAEFYNRSSLTMVISPSSGDAFAILPQHWARDEIALTWLEQGECLLHEDFVYPWPLPMAPSAQSVGSPESIPGHWPKMLRGERAPISMSEHDLQRLMAKQEVKQEAAPPRIASARKGRRPIYDWDDAMNFAKGEFERRGDYNDLQNAEDGWRSQADLVRLVSSYMAKYNGGKEPSESEVKRHLKDLFDSGRK